MSDEAEDKECPVCLRTMKAKTKYFARYKESDPVRVFSWEWECDDIDHSGERHSVTIERMAP